MKHDIIVNGVNIGSFQEAPIIAKMTLQNSQNEPYMWAYTVFQGSKVLCSGGVYHSNYPSTSQATTAIRREIEGRIDGREYTLEGAE